MFSVMIREKDGEVEILNFDAEEISIGRIQGNDIALPKGNISKRHARIVRRDNGFVIIDLRSTNGTYVNGRKITAPTMVKPDDKVYIGDFIMQIHAENAGEDTSPVAQEAAPVDDVESSLEFAAPPSDAIQMEDAQDNDAPAEEPQPAQPVETPEPVEESEPAPKVEPGDFTQYIAALSLLHERASEKVFGNKDLTNIDIDAEWESLESNVYSVVESAHQAGEIPSFLDLNGLTTDLLYEFTALGPIEHFLSDDDITEIEVNSCHQIFVRRSDGRSEEFKSFSSQKAYGEVINRLIREQTPYDPESAPPVITGQLEDGTGFRIVLPPASLGDPLLTLFKASSLAQSIQDLVDAGALNDEMATYLGKRIGEDRASVAVVSSGRQMRIAFLSTLTQLINEQERLVVLEGDGALCLTHTNVIRLDPNEPTTLEALQGLQADRMIASGLPVEDLGAFLLLSAGTVSGSMVGIYAPSADEMVNRIKTVTSVGIASPNVDALIGTGLQILLFVTPREGELPVISNITEVHVDGKGKLKTTGVFQYDDSKSKPTFVRL